MKPAFLQPEILPDASVVVIPDGATICPWCPAWNPIDPTHAGASHGMCAACFHALLADPTTGPRLDAALADNEKIDAQLREDDRRDDLREGEGSCSANCGFCGRCS
jgi:hypothetical protein